jgi:MFS family permease
LGLLLSTFGPPWPLWIGHGLFIGLIGLGGINAPLYIYISRWFDRRRGSALALISSGSYLAGAMWPPLFERAIAHLGWRPNAVFAVMCAAAVLCCIPMAMPQQHLVAFCSDIGLSLATGAAMLSVLLGAAFISRQIWGLISDRIGGLMTILIGSIAQTLALAGFLVTQDEVGLFAVSMAFGLGFSAIIPAYALAIRELFPASEAHWRIPTVLMCTGFGMALGGWLAGYLYDYFGYYLPAFAAGVGFNILNFTIIGFLVWCRMRADPPPVVSPLATA